MFSMFSIAVILNKHQFSLKTACRQREKSILSIKINPQKSKVLNRYKKSCHTRDLKISGTAAHLTRCYAEIIFLNPFFTRYRFLQASWLFRSGPDNGIILTRIHTVTAPGTLICQYMICHKLLADSCPACFLCNMLFKILPV